MNRPSPHDSSKDDTDKNRVAEFYANTTSQLQYGIYSDKKYMMDPVIEQELKTKIKFIEENPDRIDYAKDIAQIFFTLGQLRDCLAWLEHSMRLCEEPDFDLMKKIEAVEAEIKSHENQA
jgi:hypothetical protein